MKRGFSLASTLVGLILSMLILSILLDSINIMKRVDYRHYNQEIISSLQLMQILSQSENIIVDTLSIQFDHLNQQKQIKKVNDKLIISPGTLIYFTNIENFAFNVVDERIKLTIFRDIPYTYDLGYVHA
ncbi:MAG: hypothetical protein GX760_00075 [Erysipelothrix sp.]|nr:hypothetical protein [Erysipelothrix sp.]